MGRVIVPLYNSEGDFAPAVSGPSVALDTFNHNLVTGATNLVSVSLTVASNANKVLVALIGSDATLTVSSVAYTSGSGGAWAKLNSASAGAREYEIWSSVAPSNGSVTVQATYSGNFGGGDGVVQLYSLYNVNQSTPINNYASGGTVDSLVVTSDANGLALCGFCAAGNPDPLTGGGTNDMSDVNNSAWRAAHFNSSPTATFTYATGFGRLTNGCNVVAA